ncbi:hypothetical protein [Blastomonas sp. AAP53]|uniref:hypothetical protein n=1 Tax=Blastomonas sp. AAP53 TaxID=1248760 RepID=UPI0009DA3989|nr:hypothetical protein [Blastomonas sp. AAP53]
MPKTPIKPWFAVKSTGYGVGLPIAREGWLLLAAYVAFATVGGVLLSPLIFILMLIVATAILLYIAHSRSNGAWRWRDGEQP